MKVKNGSMAIMRWEGGVEKKNWRDSQHVAFVVEDGSCVSLGEA